MADLGVEYKTQLFKGVEVIALQVAKDTIVDSEKNPKKPQIAGNAAVMTKCLEGKISLL